MARTSAGTSSRKRTLFTPGFTPVSVLVIADLIHGKAAIGGDLRERDASLGILPEVFTRGGDGAAVLFSPRFVLRFHHDLEELQHGRNLIGAQLINQLMGAVWLRARQRPLLSPCSPCLHGEGESGDHLLRPRVVLDAHARFGDGARFLFSDRLVVNGVGKGTGSGDRAWLRASADGEDLRVRQTIEIGASVLGGGIHNRNFPSSTVRDVLSAARFRFEAKPSAKRASVQLSRLICDLTMCGDR